jgi:hypothetical protein
MVVKKRCLVCRGTKTLRNHGMMLKECPECFGTGKRSVEIEEPTKEVLKAIEVVKAQTEDESSSAFSIALAREQVKFAKESSKNPKSKLKSHSQEG